MLTLPGENPAYRGKGITFNHRERVNITAMIAQVKWTPMAVGLAQRKYTDITHKHRRKNPDTCLS